MVEPLKRLFAQISNAAIRIFPFFVFACMAAFPAYKGIWLGYVPLVAGILAAGWMLVREDKLREYAARCPEAWCRVVFYVAPAVVQSVLILVFRPEPAFDGLYVYQHADVLLQTGKMDPMTYYPPAQTWWYASWFAAFGVSPLVAQLSQIPLSMGITWTVRSITRDLAGETRARMAALLIAWYPSFIGYVLTTPYYHYLYTFLMVLMVWGLSRFSICDFRFANRWMVLAGLAAGLGALTKAVHLIAPLQVATWFIVLGCVTVFPWRKALLGLVVFGVCMLVVLAPWMWRNYHVFDDVVPVCTSGGLVLFSANNPESNGLYSSMPDDVVLASPMEMLEHSRWCSQQAKTFMVEQPGRFLALAWRKFIHTWGSEATFVELINWRGESRTWIKPVFSAAFFAGWSAIVGLWAASSWRAVRGRWSLSPYEILAGVIILSNALVYIVFEGGDRHHLPLVPLLVILLLQRGSNNNSERPAY